MGEFRVSLDEINRIEDLRPGDIGFGPIGGHVGMLIRAAQGIADGGSPYQHVFVVVERATRAYDSVGSMADGWFGPEAVEAMPGGAIRVDISNRWTKQFCYVRPDYQYAEQAGLVAQSAIEQIGTPYSYLDYLALAAHHIGLPVPHLDKYITSSRHMICSQLADKVLTDNDWHPFSDKRLPQDVVPSAFYNELVRRSPRLTIAYPN
jgi:hypothetical protein